MHRARRIADFWNWLPAFRAVAETGSLREAAVRLHVAPSAISRTLRLLEDAVGYPLFERAIGGLVVNAEGRHLLEGVRSAMRIVDDVTSRAPLGGPVHLRCPIDVASRLLLDAVEAWTTAHPTSAPVLHVPCADDPIASLLRGDLDVVIEFEATAAPGVDSVLLGPFTNGIYCARGPLHRRAAALDAEGLSELPFVDYPIGDLKFLRVMRRPDDQRAAHAPTMDLAVRLAGRGLGLVAVPDFVVEPMDVGLERLPHDLPLGALHLWSRRTSPGAAPNPFVEHLVRWPTFAKLLRTPRGAPSRKRAARRR